MIIIKKILIPTIYTVAIVLIGVIISTLLYYFNISSDKLNSILLYLISIIGIFTGSFKLAKNFNKKGIIIGSIYFVCWFIISIIATLLSKESFGIDKFVFYFIILIFSTLGAITGKNTKQEIK